MWGALCRFAAVLFVGLLLQPTYPAFASETVNYTYDELGRLIGASSSGSVNNGQSVSTTFDAAGNRTNYSVSGVTGGGTATISIGNASVTEGGALVFTVTRSGTTNTAVSASYATASGTATSGSDFTAASGTVSFAANETSKTISISTTDDTAVESAETMTVTLSSPSSGAAIGTATGTGTINDNDGANATISIGNASVTEGGALVFTVTRSGTTTTAVSASYATASGTATSGSDFTAASGTVSFAANETSKTISISTTDDATIESAETMTVTLSSPSSGAAIGTATGTGTINDNDSGTATYFTANTSVQEGGILYFPVGRTGDTTSPGSVNYTTVSDTATAGSDFVQTSGTLNFAANETDKQVAVQTIDDTITEPVELLNFVLSNPSGGGQLGASSAIGGIIDNDSGSASISIGNASVTEGGTLSFTVTRGGNNSTAVSASYATASGTATSGSDFTAKTGTVSFAAGVTSQTITVSTIDDATVESAETMTVTLSSPSSGATISTATGTGTINDNDVAPAQLAIGNASATEGGTLSFTVTRGGNTGTAVSASYATASGTATSGSDFTAKTGTVSFAAGVTSQTITVSTIDDTTVEATEAMTVTLSSPSSGATISTATGTGTIYDNDIAGSQLSIGNASVTEGGTLSFTVTRGGSTSTAVSASYVTDSGTAISDVDFTGTGGTVSFAAGVTSQTITVSTTDDIAVEPAETMTVMLSSPTGGATITAATGAGTINDNDVLSGGAIIIPQSYSASSIYPGIDYTGLSGTGAGMRDGDYSSENSIHLTYVEVSPWIMMDLGTVQSVGAVVMAPMDGAYFYLNGADLQRSSNGTDWVSVGTISTNADGELLQISVNSSARYLRIVGGTLLAIGDFYAKSPLP